MQLFDTHCHIHFPDYQLDTEEVIKNAHKADVNKLLCVGCTIPDSKLAISMARHRDNIWATIGIHPHEATVYINDEKLLQEFRELAKNPEVVAVGECGLDYYYMHSSKSDQAKILRFQLDLAIEYNLPLVFHVREAFEDFWKIYDEYNDEGYKIRGVVHSFSAGKNELKQILDRGLSVGINGIVTFTKNNEQLEALKSIPIEKMLLETDAPFLTPVPFRGTVCEPKHVRVTAEFISKLRGESMQSIADSTTRNAEKLFGL